MRRQERRNRRGCCIYSPKKCTNCFTSHGSKKAPRRAGIPIQTGSPEKLRRISGSTKYVTETEKHMFEGLCFGQPLLVVEDKPIKNVNENGSFDSPAWLTPILRSWRLWRGGGTGASRQRLVGGVSNGALPVARLTQSRIPKGSGCGWGVVEAILDFGGHPRFQTMLLFSPSGFKGSLSLLDICLFVVFFQGTQAHGRLQAVLSTLGSLFQTRKPSDG